jgi:hypothetical protein
MFRLISPYSDYDGWKIMIFFLKKTYFLIYFLHQKLKNKKNKLYTIIDS